MENYSLSSYEQSCLLLDGPGLGEEKPSALMAKMLALASDSDRQSDLFRNIFLRTLPDDIRAPLLHTGEKDCLKLAHEADTLWSAKSVSPANMVATSTSAASANAVAKPTPLSKATKTSGSTFARWSEGWKQQPAGPCAFHAYFGADARKCRQPCSMTTAAGNASAGRQ